MSDADLPPDPFGTPAPSGRVHRGADGRLHVEAAVEVIPLNLDAPDTAQWCDECLLPSGLAVRFRILMNGAPLATTLTLTICRDCGATTRRTT